MRLPCHADNEPGAGGGGDDDGGGSAGGGGAGWSGPWDDEDFDEEEAEPSPVLSVADAWLWRMGCLVVALQVCARSDLPAVITGPVAVVRTITCDAMQTSMCFLTTFHS